MLLLSLPVVSSVAMAVDLQRGQRIYNTHCSVCHGLNGVPVIQQAPSFANKDRLMQPDMALMQSVKTGKTLMPPFMGILKDEEILDAIRYARILR
ncbi:MAG: cytochrome c [Rhodocyclales bacterium]|nr:cytochrome c [Rhodocyclales bacterium]